jgi:hypothetical protein
LEHALRFYYIIKVLISGRVPFCNPADVIWKENELSAFETIVFCKPTKKIAIRTRQASPVEEANTTLFHRVHVDLDGSMVFAIPGIDNTNDIFQSIGPFNVVIYRVR